MKRSYFKALLALLAIVGSFNLSSAQEQKTVQKLVKLPLREGGYDSFLALMRINIEQSRKEEGNISFTLFGKDDSYTVYLVERYNSEEAWNNHEESVYARSTEGIAPAATMNMLHETTLNEIAEIPAEATKDVAAEENTQNIIVWFTTKPDTRTAFIEAMSKAILKARNAEGNLGYNIYQNAENANEFIVIERWKNPEVHQTHLQNDYSLQLNKDLEGLLTEDPKFKREVLKNISE
ncbi:putative quinol monooxygenase [Zunongwangia atlantica]|uniref:Antibiotic biosynthesis monooxygenase n=1 Tax=Zunongwangia atlantica 22II14-10F7 TaxID=1185767 RepID=A0A1Y1T8K7_9FLAO|nr:antibiotic biosynthesis monooxygenase [Zunongwangia atlantica]ORL47042.1 antibiotic biosynthesis monooxygenase [Zunongwangia atlantica 22II14-10F7]